MALISFRLTKVFLLFGCVVFLAGCGFKGPLYLPAGKTETR